MVIWAVYNPAAAISAEDDQVFVEMINQIRRDPYDYASNYLECTPEFLKTRGIEPDTTFDDYTLDDGLTGMAETESQSNADESNAGEDISESEEPPVHRFRLTASTGGVVSFFNFMTRETAFKIVIDYLFKEELDSSNTFDHILSEDYSYAGIAISAGKVGSGNAWFIAISLRSAELISEIQMLNLINQVRSNPENIWGYTNWNREEVLNQKPALFDLVACEYKPLFFNASLSASASEAEAAPETDAYHGYEGEIVQESEVDVLCLTEEDSRSVEFLFSSLIYYELIGWPLSPVTFLTDFQDIGSSVAFQPGDGIDTSVLSFVVGRNDPNYSDDENSTSNDDQMSKIYGILFSDNDGDGLYAPGEELIQKDVTVSVYADDVEGMKELKTVRTDNAGHFSMTLETNRQYNFVAAIDENVQVAWDGNDGNLFITSDQFVKLVYTPTPPENNILAVDIQ